MAESSGPQATEPQSEKDLTQKGAGVPDEAVAPPEPEVKNLALSTPRHDVPVAVSVVGGQNTHTPPDLKAFDPQGRPRD